MEDKRIIELFWQRNENAIKEVSEKYGAYCRTVAKNITDNTEDSEECVNDTWLRAWNSIPPQKPDNLKIFLARITRNLAYDKYNSSHALKRGGGETALVLEELEYCIASRNDVENSVISKELGESINRFIRNSAERDANVFIRRYFFVEPTAVIGKKFGLTENNVKAILFRMRKKLRTHLIKEGYIHENQ